MSSAEWYEGQEILIECPVWSWEPSSIAGVTYEVCFDDIDHCAEAEIGDAVCIPNLGEHDVWVTAIDWQGAEPVYYDGDSVAIRRARNADFSGNATVDLGDLFSLLDKLGLTGDFPEDLNEDGVVDLADLMVLLDDLGKCVSDNGSLYQSC